MANDKQKSIISLLAAAYPNAGCELDFKDSFQLLVAVILSAQCTDKRVNVVTDKLFKDYSTPQDFALMPQVVLEKYIFSCGFYHNKAKNIIGCAQGIMERFGGQVPSTLPELTSLSGVGRKTANVVLSVAFNVDAVAVDTHVFRVSKRLGFSKANNPDAVESDLVRIFKGHNLGIVHHVLIFHGRYCCHSRSPKCGECPVKDLCTHLKK